MLAIHRGRAAELTELLNRDALLVSQRFADMPYGNLELKGATLLHLAVEFGEAECIDVLLEHGANINAPADIIDGIGGQTPIFHAIATNEAANLPVREHLVRRVGSQLDLSLRATFRVFGEVQSNPLTPLEYAHRAATDDVPQWRRATRREIELLGSLIPPYPL